MKLIRSNGDRLTVRDVGPITYSLTRRAKMPLPVLDEIMTEDECRKFLTRLLMTGHYKGVRKDG